MTVYEGWTIIKDCDDGSFIIQKSNGERRHIWHSYNKKALSLLEQSVEYIQDWLLRHDTELGRTTNKNRRLAEEAEFLIKEIKCFMLLQEFQEY